MLSIFRTKPLDQAFSVIKYKDLLAKNYKDILLYEINANSYSYTINKIITEKGDKRYIIGVRVTTIALVSSIVLILTNKFIIIEKAPTKVQEVNISKMIRITKKSRNYLICNMYCNGKLNSLNN